METLFGTSAHESPPGPDAGLIAAYVRTGRTLDDLPYTHDWQILLEHINAAKASTQEQREYFHRLVSLRKAGGLPRLGRSDSTAIKVTSEDEAYITSAVIEAVGTLGARDRLLFTPAFDSLAQGFNAATGRGLSPYEVWRLVAKICK